MAEHALQTLVIGLESCAHTSLPQIGQVVLAGRPQMLQMPIIDIAWSEAAASDINASRSGGVQRTTRPINGANSQSARSTRLSCETTNISGSEATSPSSWNGPTNECMSWLYSLKPEKG